jgi:hypothetical protein
LAWEATLTIGGEPMTVEPSVVVLAISEVIG